MDQGQKCLASPSLEVELTVSPLYGPGVWIGRKTGYYDGERLFVGIREFPGLIAALCKIKADLQVFGKGKGPRSRKENELGG